MKSKTSKTAELLRKVGATEAESLLEKFFDLKSSIAESRDKLRSLNEQRVRVMGDTTLSDAEVKARAGSLKEERDFTIDRVQVLSEQLQQVESRFFDDCNRAWSRFIAMKSKCQAAAWEIAEKLLRTTGLANDWQEGDVNVAVRRSRIYLQETNEQFLLYSPNEMQNFLEVTVPTMIGLWEPLTRRVQWYEEILAGKRKWGPFPKECALVGPMVAKSADWNITKAEMEIHAGIEEWHSMSREQQLIELWGEDHLREWRKEKRRRLKKMEHRIEKGLGSGVWKSD